MQAELALPLGHLVLDQALVFTAIVTIDASGPDLPAAFEGVQADGADLTASVDKA